MKKIIHYFSRSTVRLLEITLGIAIVLMVGLGFTLWQMSRAPFDLMFAENYIESALSTDEYRVDFKDIDLKWPEMRGPLRLGVADMRVITADGATALSVDEADIGISSAFLLAGMVRPVSLYLSNPTFRLVREADGSVSFLFQSDTAPDDDTPPLAEQIRDILEKMSGEGDDSFLNRFRRLHIQNAHLMMEDRVSGEDIEISELNAQFRRSRHGAYATADLLLNEKLNNGVGGVSVSMDYNRESGDMKADAVFKNLGPAILTKLLPHDEIIERQAGTVDGRIAILRDKDSRLRDISGDIAVKKAEIYWPQEYDVPLQMSAFNLAFGFDPETQRLESTRFDANVQGVPVTGKLAVQMRDDGYDVLIDALVPEVQQEVVESLFPKSEMDGELAEWLVHKMDGGIFRNVTFKAPLYFNRLSDETGVSEWETVFREADMYIGFEAEGVNLTYQDTLKPALDIKGHGFFDGKKLDITGESGRIEDVQAHDVKVIVDDVAVKGGGYADISVNAKGPLSTLLAYISDEPIAMGEDIGFKPEEVKGTADIHVTVSLPTTEDVAKEDVKVKVTGTLTDLSLPRVVEGLTLTEGPLELETIEGGFNLKGDAKLEGQALTLTGMTQYFSSEGREFLTKVEAKVISDGDLRDKFGVGLSDYISGDVPLEISYLDNGKGKETVAVKGDLNPTTVHIKPFAYEKKPGVPGSLSLDAVMDNGRLTKVSNLNVTTKDLSLSKGTLTFRSLKKGGVELSGGKIPSAKIGKSVADVDFTITPENVLKITAVSPVFDAKPFLETCGRRKAQESGDQAQSQAMTINLKADKVLALHNQTLEGLKLYAEMDKDSDITRIELSGRTDKSDVSILFRPDPQTGKRFFRLETMDGGALLAAAGLYENVHGGSLMVFGTPKEGSTSTGNLYGTAQLENFKVVKAPGLAKLLSLMSLGGVRDLLNQQGIAFSKLESDFEWRFQPEGNLLLIENGRTSGSSVGLTFAGVIDRGADTTDIKGTIIPMTEINNILKSIPVIGNILTGGTGLIAATYTMRGPSEDPSVMVNPLSVLAPGFLRTILFEGGFSKKPVAEVVDARKKQATVKPPVSESRTAGN